MVTAKRTCDLGAYLDVLAHELIAYDRAQSAREAKRAFGRVNIYRMGLLLEAKQKVEKNILAKHARSSTSPDALLALTVELYAHFEQNFPPIKKVIKQIDAGTCRIK